MDWHGARRGASIEDRRKAGSYSLAQKQTLESAMAAARPKKYIPNANNITGDVVNGKIDRSGVSQIVKAIGGGRAFKEFFGGH